MDIQILQWIGYIASGIIALSMTMNSIVKFRWINLVGALSFALYGLLIKAYPVFLLNSFILLVDVFYLRRIYTKKHLFDILEIRGDNKYLLKFLDFYMEDIQKFFPGFEYKPEINTVSFFVLRNTAVAGIFLAHLKEESILEVGLDYVTPQYRDYKSGKYVYKHLKDYFQNEGFQKIETKSTSPKHVRYLKRLGFEPTANNHFIKTL